MTLPLLAVSTCSDEERTHKMQLGCQLVLLTIKKRQGVSMSSSKIRMHGLDATVEKIWVGGIYQ